MCVTPDMSVREAAIQMCFNKISGMPVINDNRDIVGVISEKDILHKMYPGVHEFMQDGVFSFEDLETEYRDIINLRVEEIMTGRVFTVSPEIPVLRAASIMFLNKIRRIPVAEGKKLVGIISIGDVHKALFKKNIDEQLLTPASETAGPLAQNIVRL
jgi:CBS domain-containing protein